MSYLNDSTNKINDIFVLFCLQCKLVDAVRGTIRLFFSCLAQLEKY